MAGMTSMHAAASSDDYFHGTDPWPDEEDDGPASVDMADVVSIALAPIDVLPGTLTVERIAGKETEVRVRFSTAAKARHAFEWLRGEIVRVLVGYEVVNDPEHASAILVRER
jgi:hypothetical protein